MSGGRRGAQGFTLVELMVTITVLAILLAIAAPSFVDFVRRNDVSSNTNEFLTTLRMARSTAITRNIFVSVCPSTNATADKPSCSDSKDYSAGYLVYVASAAGKAYEEGNELVRINEGAQKVSIMVTDAAKIITFNPRGASTIGTFSAFLCARHGNETVGESTGRATGRRFDVQASGRAGVVELPAQAGDAASGSCSPGTG
ncbi:GspH/FimT family pseudopilin [Luteibacter aegosomaticola]|uniref:GspH/FimT family pseudopilin n=1 Tax=Luteibacter aegosomaticola TaxID=2911538 RepID=UPI001FF8E993|nr:GspH/FimT family pseudopilin [Luteibacter aegosomaticola]UPG88884.1 GspH/FimT family pseudopilin [Luteibacter aegosomaticola]